MKTDGTDSMPNESRTIRRLVHVLVLGLHTVALALSPSRIALADEGTHSPVPLKVSASFLDSCSQTAQVAFRVTAHANGEIEFTGQSATKILGIKKSVLDLQQAQSLLRRAEKIAHSGGGRSQGSGNDNNSLRFCLDITVQPSTREKSRTRKMSFAANQDFALDFMSTTKAAQWVCPSRLMNVSVLARQMVATVCHSLGDSRIGYLHRRLSENCMIAEVADIYDEGTVHHYIMRNWNRDNDQIYLEEEFQQLSPEGFRELLTLLRNLRLPESEPLSTESQTESRHFRVRIGGMEQAETIWDWLEGKASLQHWQVSGIAATCGDAGPPSHIQVEERFLQ